MAERGVKSEQINLRGATFFASMAFIDGAASFMAFAIDKPLPGIGLVTLGFINLATSKKELKQYTREKKLEKETQQFKEKIPDHLPETV